MPRPENPELCERIVGCAFALFREKGYRATSYSDLAKAAGITKGLLQYHFPKKDQLATKVMVCVLDKASAALGTKPPSTAHNATTYRDLYRIGQAYFYYLLAPNNFRLFLKDVVSNLDLIDSVLTFNLDWALRYALDDAQADEDNVVESVVMAMGGFYSLLHYNLVHDRETDIAHHLGAVMDKVMQALGFSKSEIEGALQDAQLTKTERAALLKAMESAK